MLSLANWAEKGGPLGLHYADDNALGALQARVAGALINAVFILEIARLVVSGAVSAVAERGTLMPDGLVQYFLQGGMDGCPVAWFQFVAGLSRVDARTVQYFGGVQISHTGQSMLVHHGHFDRTAAAAKSLS
jgi:hypothetical protein